MNYKSILFNQARNLKRIEQLRNENYGIKGIDYNGDKIQTSGKKSIIENQVIKLNQNPEYKELLKYTEAVNRVIDCLTYRQCIVYNEYFKNKKPHKDIIREHPLSSSTLYRDIEIIVYLLEKELWKVGKIWEHRLILGAIIYIMEE